MLSLLLALLFQPALTEDGCAPHVQVCVWDATFRGNGQGEVVIIVGA
jgi:hypothetical protein